MNSSGVVHRRGFAVLILLSAIALAVYLVHARLNDDTPKTRSGSQGKVPAAKQVKPVGEQPAGDQAAGNGPPAYGADGGGNDYGAAPAGNAAPAAPVGFKTTSLSAKKLPRMGTVVVDSAGWTLYRFDNDSADPPTSNCDGECAQTWPPILTEGEPQLAGIAKDKVGTVTRKDGSRQLTLDGWPLYRYAPDAKAGAWKGQAVKNVWWVVSETGARNLTCLPPGAVPPTS